MHWKAESHWGVSLSKVQTRKMIVEINFICFEKNVLKNVFRRIQVKFSGWRRSFRTCTKTYQRLGDVSVAFMHQWVSSSVWNHWERRALEEHSPLETCFLRVYVVEKTSLSDRQIIKGQIHNNNNKKPHWVWKYSMKISKPLSNTKRF